MKQKIKVWYLQILSSWSRDFESPGNSAETTQHLAKGTAYMASKR
jgi:hypothetical protein